MLTNVIIYGELDKQLDNNFRYVIAKSVDAIHEKENTFKKMSCHFSLQYILFSLFSTLPPGIHITENRGDGQDGGVGRPRTHLHPQTHQNYYSQSNYLKEQLED